NKVLALSTLAMMAPAATSVLSSTSRSTNMYSSSLTDRRSSLISTVSLICPASRGRIRQRLAMMATDALPPLLNTAGWCHSPGGGYFAARHHILAAERRVLPPERQRSSLPQRLAGVLYSTPRRSAERG